ncbi:MAG: hypothetical protein LBQ39_03625, partial [Tannerellaceae bacterium]|nr:hypothetical protein [Tannerellaceae bacterium]
HLRLHTDPIGLIITYSGLAKGAKVVALIAPLPPFCGQRPDGYFSYHLMCVPMLAFNNIIFMVTSICFL